MIELFSYFVTVVACTMAGAFFSGMETGVISINRMRLRHFVRRKDHMAKILQGFVDDSDRLLGTTLLGNNIVTVITAVISASLFMRLLGGWGEVVSSVVVSVVVLVFSEYLPKAWFRARPYERCREFAGVLSLAEIILRPFSAGIVWLASWLVPGPKKSFSKPSPFATIEDLKTIVRDSEKDGALSKTERVMIHRVFELSGKTAAQIMTPKEKMVVVDADMSLEDFYKLAAEKGFTRIPVWDREKQEYIGILNVLYILSTGEKDKTRLVRDFIKPPLFISASMPVDDIFPSLRRSRQPMCFIRNEENKVIGLVTTEDILEEIIGQL